MKTKNCHKKLFGDYFCRKARNHTIFIFFIMDADLFFLDTFLWYIIEIPFNLDALEGYLCSITEAHIFQDPRDLRSRGSVISQGAFRETLIPIDPPLQALVSQICDYHPHVLRALSDH